MEESQSGRIANLLKEGRTKKNLTQLQVANHLNFKSMDRISRWENGNAEPSGKNLIQLMNLYGIPMNEVLNIWKK